jgi:ssRNA-specific RNase YbeY (16S rRNA maturation enzyme)
MINKTDVISFPFNEGVMQRETSKEIPDWEEFILLIADIFVQ